MRRFPKSKLKEFEVFKKLNSPAKIQDFVDSIRINFGETCRSPLMALRHKEAHCVEGAMLAAAILWHQGKKPLLLDLETTVDDDSHVVALFKRKNRWGAISKTNHAILRYRDPVYKTVRELAMSYFNEYFLDSGIKTLRNYSAPFSLLKYNEYWLTSKKSLRDIVKDLEKSEHFKILPNNGTRHLRLADPIELKAGKLLLRRKK